MCLRKWPSLLGNDTGGVYVHRSFRTLNWLEVNFPGRDRGPRELMSPSYERKDRPLNAGTIECRPGLYLHEKFRIDNI